MTTKTETRFEHAKKVLADLISQAKEYDQRGDVTLRNKIISRLRGDDYGLPTAYVEAALRNAGLIR